MRRIAPRARLFCLIVCLSLLAQSMLPAPAGASPGGSMGKAAASTARAAVRQEAEAADLPDLNEARNRPHHEPKAVPPVPSTRRRCPPHNPRCNDDVDGSARPTPTPAPRPGGGRAALQGAPVDSLAALAGRSLLTVAAAALNGGSPLVGVDALDYYRSDGGYGYSDSAPRSPLASAQGGYRGSAVTAVAAAAAAVQGGGAVNLALGKAATQSSTLAYNPPGDAWHAVDGNTDGNYFAATVTHTNGDNQAWWQVDLGSVQPISNIDLWNRTDCCPDRLSNFYVFVSDAPFASADAAQTQAQAGVWTAYSPGQAPVHSTLAVNRTGRYVRVQLAGAGILSLAEVQVFAGAATGETVWVDDMPPAGATLAADADGWNWVGAGPPPSSGFLSHQSSVAAGLHQHFFYGASAKLPVGAGERMFAYVYLDPANVPAEVMLQWNSDQEGWNHRAYWGANLLGWGTDGTGSRRYMGPLPGAGGWVRLEVPAGLVGLEGKTLNGMAFSLYGGRATWDRAGKFSPAYNGAPLAIPGNVEIEHFDIGGQNSAYFDTSAGTHGQDYTQPPYYPPPSFRQPTDVDIYKSADYSGGYLIVMQAGDWMNYTVEVAAAGTYTLDARTYYWGSLGGTFHVEFDGVDKTGQLRMPGGSRWEQVSKAGIQLTAGRHVMRVVADTNAPDGPYLGDIDFIKFFPAEARAGTGLTGEYYDNIDFTGYAMTRTDATVGFDWGGGSPAASMGVDEFSVRWTGVVVPLYTQSYTFYTYTDDGVRLWVDGQLVIDKWIDQAPQEWAGTVALEAGRAYAVRMEFYERGGGATAKLLWSSASQAKEIIPQSQLYGCWKGADQFTNDFFQGALARRPSAAELNDWMGKLTQAQGEAQLVGDAQALGAQVFNSTEYANRNRSDSDYVADLYWAYLQRAPDQSGWNFWTSQITPCGSDQQCRATKRADVRRAFDQSGEFQEKVRALCGTSSAAAANGGVGYDFSTARLDPSNRTGGEGADAYSRNYAFSIPLLSLAGRAGLDLGLTLAYNSLVWTKDAGGVAFDADQGFPSPGFRLGFPVVQPKFVNPQLQQQGQPVRYSYLLVTPGGERVELRQVGTSNVYESADSSYLQLKEGDGAPLALRSPDGTKLSFSLINGEYRCYETRDRNGNYISAAYYPDGRINRVTDTMGRVITFNYDTFLNLNSITQPWKRETEAGVVEGPHAWATFGYTNVTLLPQFSSLAVMGEQPGTVIPAINQVGLADGSYYRFEYNQWGQVWKMTHFAADSVDAQLRPTDTHPLSYTRLDLPGSDLAPASPQADCPRFTLEKTWVENGVMNQSAEVTISYSPWAPNMASCDVTPPDPTPGSDASDDVVIRESYATSGWRRGLTTQAEAQAAGQTRKWTTFLWEHDGGEGAGYQTNPRVYDTTVNDSEGHRRRTRVNYTAAFGLPREVIEYKDDAVNPLRRTETDYLTDPTADAAYLNRRVIGLVKERRVYGLDPSTNVERLYSKTDYRYDWGTVNGVAYLQQQGSPVQHYDEGVVVGRGNLTSVRRWDVTSPASPSLAAESTSGYNTDGSVIFTQDPSGHKETFDYADRFWSPASLPAEISRNTFAYPTTTTDPDGFSSTVEYIYDMGVAREARSPKPNEMLTSQPGPIRRSYYDGAGRVVKALTVDNGAYTKWVYAARMDVVQSYTAIEAGKESYTVQVLDGAGRTRASAHNLPGSGGGYAGQLFDYDVLGRLARQTSPTETTAAGAWPATGDDAANGWLYAETRYDWKGRPLVISGPAAPGTQGTTTEFIYGGCGCAGGDTVTTRDENGRRQKSTADVLGRVWKTQLLNFQDKTQPLTEGTDSDVYSTTTTTFNPLDQATSVTVQAGTSGTAQVTTRTYDGHGRLQSEHKPEQNANTATTYTYYADDTVYTVTDARGATTTYGYNGRHLVTGVSYAGANITVAPPVTFSYDAAGNRMAMDDGPGRTDYAYDMLSRLSSETRQLDGVGTYSLGYTYNLADELERVTDSTFGTTFTNKYDAAGRANGLTGTGYGTVSQFLTDATYRAWGAAKSISYGNGRQMVLGYDKQMHINRATLAGVMDRSYQYFSDGRIAYSHDFINNKHDRSYNYDLAGRRTSAFSGFEARPGGVSSEGWGPYRQTYEYDTWGNMTGRTWLTWFTTPTGSTVPQSNYYSASYTNNQLVSSSTSGSSTSTTWNYDLEGNLTHTASGTSQYWYGYDQAGQLVDTVEPNRSTHRTYDGDGERVSQTVGTTTTYYVRSTALDGQVLLEVNPSGQKLRSYVYSGTSPLATQEGTGAQVRWEHRDPTGVSIFWTYTDSTYSAGEYDPLGVPAPDVPGLTFNYNPPYNGGNFNSPDMGCLIDNIPSSCSLARRLISNGVGVPCPNNDCGPQRYHTPEGDIITKPYQCFADGYCDYLPAGVTYVGDGYLVEGDLGTEHVRFSDITGDWREGLVGNFIGISGNQKGRRKPQRKPKPDTTTGRLPTPSELETLPRVNEVKSLEPTQAQIDCDKILAGIFGGKGALAAGNGFDPEGSPTARGGRYRGDYIDERGRFQEGHLGSRAMHLYGEGGGSTDVYIPGGGTYLGRNPNSNENSYMFYYARLGNAQGVTLFTAHVANFIAPAKGTYFAGRTRIGQIGGRGGEGGGIWWPHSHLAMHKGRGYTGNRLPFAQVFCSP